MHDVISLQKYLTNLQQDELSYIIITDVHKLEQLNKQYLQALAKFKEPQISRQEFEQQLEACLLDTKAGDALQEKMLSIADDLENKSKAGFMLKLFYRLEFTFRRLLGYQVNNVTTKISIACYHTTNYQINFSRTLPASAGG